jgi:hypothetical protein
VTGSTTTTISVPPGSRLAELLASASDSGAPLIVESGATRYRLDVRPAAAPGDSRPTEPDDPTAPLTPPELYHALAEQRDVRSLLKRLAVDAELREVAERLEGSLCAQHPELFDRRGRVRKAAMSRLLSERSGGRVRLSGGDLRVLEEQADAEAARAAGAP